MKAKLHEAKFFGRCLKVGEKNKNITKHASYFKKDELNENQPDKHGIDFIKNDDTLRLS